MMKHATMIVLSAALLGGCSNKDEAPPPQLAPAAPQAEAPAAPELKAEELEQSHLDAQAPMVLTIDTPDNYAQPGEIEITAKITAPQKLNAPTAIIVTVPEGAELVSGQSREQLADLPAGVITRTFKFKLSKGLHTASPIEIAVDVRDPGGAFGAHAKRVFPKVKVQKPLKASRFPAPPGGRPGLGKSAPVGARTAPKR
jgi:hypothetical protein